MEADSFRIAKVFMNGGDIHFRLPYFQREYAWKQENWQTLLDDILDLYEIYNDEKPPEHFMGSLVVIYERTVGGVISCFKVVDGQQRLTTISLILCALADLVKETNPGLQKSIRKYITNPDETDEIHYKLLPTTKSGDRITYQSILHGQTDELQSSSQTLPAYQFYRSELSSRLDRGEITADKLFLVILNSLQVVFINLNQNERPYQIFESLNAKGKPLTQADLVRNYIAMKLPENRQADVFENHWSKIENMLQDKRFVGRSRLGELTAFIRHYLAYRNGVLCNEEHVYARFRDRVETNFLTTGAFEAEIQTLKRLAGYYDRFLRPENEPDLRLRSLLGRLNILEFTTGYPVLLMLYDALYNDQITCDQLVESLQDLENYMVRRYLTGAPTNYLNKALPTVWRELNFDDFLHSFKRALLQRDYPADYRLQQAAHAKRLYDQSGPTRAKTVLVLNSINRQISRAQNQGAYTVLDGDATIEHVMPQTLSEDWKNDLGENYQQIYNQCLNTLGNLTLVTADWNSRLSNEKFLVKQPCLASHGLIMNYDYFNRNIPVWNDTAIKDRADYLLRYILDCWPALGEPPQPRSTAGTRPVSLRICDQHFTVESWRDVAFTTTETIIQLVDHFEQIAASLPPFLRLEPFPNANRQLSNGWYLNLNLSANAIKDYCSRLIREAGLAAGDWKVEEA